MNTFTKALLSGSTNGKAIKVDQIAAGSSATLIHTAIAGVVSEDEIWLWAVNNSTTDQVELSLQWGDATVPDGIIPGTVPPRSGLFAIVPGLLLQNGLEIRAFASIANVICIHGFVNRIT